MAEFSPQQQVAPMSGEKKGISKWIWIALAVIVILILVFVFWPGGSDDSGDSGLGTGGDSGGSVDAGGNVGDAELDAAFGDVIVGDGDDVELGGVL